MFELKFRFEKGSYYTVAFFSPAQTAVSKYEATKQKRKFSSFFKSLVIELDKDLYGPDNHLVEVRSFISLISSSVKICFLNINIVFF